MFVEDAFTLRAYTDDALPIGYGQTISKLSTVAVMTAALDPKPGEKVLEVGTGSGYQAAVLSRLSREVYSIERIAGLAVKAQGLFNRLGVFNVKVRTGDGAQGWPEAAPFDKIIVTAAAETLPRELLNQMAIGGRLVLPIGDGGEGQVLRMLVRQGENDWEEWNIDNCHFVPLVRQAQWR
jgi:protein-L-isoaspartate(D-aspartate) O-methyltransferase